MERKNFEFANLDNMVKSLGKEEVHRLAERMKANEQYRKNRNIKQQAIIEMAKKDPRFIAAVEEATKLVKK